ncbi:MAG: chitin disaccharide deacetylase [Clostridium sp.]|nr:chitin disaccharide deacetylase [Clostridium sp.]
MKLMINGDDFGFSPGQNLGIMKAHAKGILTSTSVMANGEYLEEALTLAKPYPDLAIGVHLLIDCGAPILPINQIKTLVDDQGLFLKHKKDSHIDVNHDEVFLEWCAQIDKIISLGITPTHIDGHHHMHLHPSLLTITLKVAKKYQLPMRYFPFYHGEKETQLVKDSGAKVYTCLTEFYQEGVNEDYFESFSKNHITKNDEILEVMCHPAYVDDIIYLKSSYNIHRIKELVVLISPKVKNSIVAQRITLVNPKNF